MALDVLRRRMLELIAGRTPATDLKACSLAAGKNHAYLHQFIYRGTPRRLPEDVRYRLASFLGIDESLLRADDPRAMKPVAVVAKPVGRGADRGAAKGASRSESRGASRGERLARAKSLMRSTAAASKLTQVREMAVRAAAGGGKLVENEDEGARWQFPTAWVQTELRAVGSDLRIITIDGDSMEPLLLPGDKVLVDTSRRAPSPPGVFVLFDGLGLVAKQVEHVPNSDPPKLAITSANPRYQRYDRTAEEVSIIGRVVWFARRM
jgi:phage repressor protein C with HTH and peptisase S24 domain